MNFLLVCGGTAGHINPALAIAIQLRRTVRNSKILFVGAGKDLEKKLIPLAGFHLVNIKMSGLKRGLSLSELAYNLKTARNLTTAGIKAEKLLRRFKPDAVIGTGGYICYPILKKASQMGIPTVIHGSDAIPGLTAKLLSATVDKVLVSFPGLEKLYRKPERVIFTGTPVRVGFRAQSEGDKTKRIGSKPLVLSFWGSQGAEKMNATISEFIKLNIDRGSFDHIHAAGSNEAIKEMKNRLARLGAPGDLPEGIEMKEYIDDMPSVMAAADLVVCRAGASTLAELAAMGKPAVLVPSPYVTNNHQEENAKQLLKVGGAEVILEKNCTGETLFDVVSSLLSNRDALERMSQAQKALAAPDAVERIIEVVMSLTIKN
ncbi:MAG: UDP-N-acetylglucosamine--N-acetylmuramyl-(pentapeptide) pyrophosphoryl-undecaprenol N-acetylglucosamine transferase [Oscillospiraceae bacterium]|nr:UDP-N-acetylglucosamine--N-acetylmuramyl-(pentapeptide) pyrophosphoryl-undecaprenol N-acetylglucosamine transferase [Oscillospiraceae bacterium]